ncbi:MAG: exosortase/archaeosortase family protein [Planctomycetes bacterium]|nr:exosortase/archaeosortase family protein [Planctomycetota bacterium]
MDELATLLDAVLLVVFGVWAYRVARGKRRDEVGWALAVGVAYWLPGYAVQAAIFPFLARKLDWAEAVQKAWQKPSGFIVGALCALAADLYLTFFVKPLAPPEKEGGEGPPAPPGTTAPPPEEGAEAPPARGGKAGAAAQEMAAAPPAEVFGLRADGPLGYVLRYWPAAIVVLIYLLPTFEAVASRLEHLRVHAGPYPPYRELALPLLVGAQVWLLGRRLAPALLCALFCVAFIPGINWMEWEWSRGSSYYSHGYLIPFVALGLVWSNRQRLAKLKPQGDLRAVGLATLAAGLLMLLAGAYLRRGSIQGMSLLVILCGLVFFLYGRAVTRALLFPLLFTVSMIPLSMWMLDALTFPLKTFATAGTVRVVNALHAAGLQRQPVAQDGNDVGWVGLDGKPDKLTVAEACSGLKSLIALLTFGALLAYLAKLSRRHKLVLFAAGVPVALLANMWRIVTLVLVASRWSSEIARPDTWVHDSTGLGIFAVAFVLFFAFERVLREFESAPEPQGSTALAAPAP